MIRIITTSLLFFLIVGSVVAEPTDYPGVMQIGIAQVRPGESFAVNVRMTGNDRNLSAIFLPLRFEESDIAFDSISIVGTVWQGDFFTAMAYDDDLQSHRLFVLPDVVDPIPTTSFSSGVVMKLCFTASAAARPRTIPLDTAYHDTLIAGVHVYSRPEATGANGTQNLLPGFVAGSIQIMAPTGVEDGTSSSLPTDFTLSQNYPNPFNPTTIIEFGLPASSHVKLDVFNILGQTVMTMIDRHMPAGYHSVELDASDLPSGIYFYRLASDEGNLTRKMVLLK